MHTDIHTDAHVPQNRQNVHLIQLSRPQSSLSPSRAHTQTHKRIHLDTFSHTQAVESVCIRRMYPHCTTLHHADPHCTQTNAGGRSRLHSLNASSLQHAATHCTHKHRRPKPFAFVEFINIDEAHDAMDAMDRREFQGRVIDVVFAQQKRKSSNEMSARDGPPPRR